MFTKYASTTFSPKRVLFSFFIFAFPTNLFKTEKERPKWKFKHCLYTNVNDTYVQLETRDVYSDGYVTKEKWEEIIQKDVEQQTSIEILKPTSSSDISYILHLTRQKKLILVTFSLSVNYMGHKKTRTREIEYIKTDNGFKIHSFEVDILYAEGRWGLY